ncbi:MAG: M20/M25/M40 family metallo-hydrolase [Tenuifilaceae bacterium]|nr:M20/M25/M40 family metallo-hydrolase [Tenuifilaceae bacterium]
MKKTFLLLFTLFISISIFSQSLVLIPKNQEQSLSSLFVNPKIKVHHYSNEFFIATCFAPLKNNMVVLDSSPWEKDISYYIVYTDKNIDKDSYLATISKLSTLLYKNSNFLIVKINESIHGQLTPAKNDGMVRINNNEARLSSYSITQSKRDAIPEPYIETLLAQVSGVNITSTVQHLQDYGTRDAYTSQSVVAQQWISQEFTNLGLVVETMDFTMPGGPASDNVIATLTGTKYPDQYVVIGGHYDSINRNSSNAPGADDNASGTAAVLEIARILSEQELDRSIIFCAFSGEEYGLYGSAAFAQRCANQGMNILGYFNLDMIGYLHVGNTMKTTLIYPQSAQDLANFYTTICATYLPAFVVETGTLSGGDSDHTSFNNNGFMGIYPFENIDAYSPYIHTANDIIGLSYNNEEQAVVYTKASLAAAVTLANRIFPPQNLVAIPQNGSVVLNWDEMVGIDNYNVYRDDAIIASTVENTYTDNDVSNGTEYVYYITAIYSDTQEESDLSNVATVTPTTPIELPFFTDFERGVNYWKSVNGWGIATDQYYSGNHSFTESPNGTYANSLKSTATLSYFNLEGYTSANLSFYTKYEIETNWDFIWFEASSDGKTWTELEEFTGNQTSWLQKGYDLSNYLNKPYVIFRFRFESDKSVTKQGMYIDDFKVYGEKPASNIAPNSLPKLKVYPNPASHNVNIEVENNQNMTIKIFNQLGRLMLKKESIGKTNFSTSKWPAGVYIVEVRTATKIYTEKLIVR